MKHLEHFRKMRRWEEEKIKRQLDCKGIEGLA
jgi:hypothetical protein